MGAVIICVLLSAGYGLFIPTRLALLDYQECYASHLLSGWALPSGNPSENPHHPSLRWKFLLITSCHRPNSIKQNHKIMKDNTFGSKKHLKKNSLWLYMSATPPSSFLLLVAQWLERRCASLVAEGEPDHAAAIFYIFVNYMLSFRTGVGRRLAGNLTILNSPLALTSGKAYCHSPTQPQLKLGWTK